MTSLPSVLAAVSTEPLTEKFAGYNDPIFYIYTSGTTGMPKVTYKTLGSSYLASFGVAPSLCE